MTGVNPETYYAAAKQLRAIGSGIDTAIGALLKALDGTNSMSGTSQAARKWATGYDTRAQQAVDTAHKVAQTLPYFAYLVALAGYNHELSDYNADISKKNRKPPDKPVAVDKPIALSWVHPPSAGGPGNGLISFAALMEQVHIHVPDGDADKLAKAANAWKAFNQADAVADAHAEIVKVAGTLGVLQSPEIPDLTDCLTTLQNSAWNLCGTTNQLAGDCLAHKMALDNLRHRIDKVIGELDALLGAQLVVTIAAAFLSVGTAAVAAGGADAAVSAAEVSAAAEKITEIVDAVDGDGILVEAASEEDTLATAGKELDEIAELEPETLEEDEAESATTPASATAADTELSSLFENGQVPKASDVEKYAQEQGWAKSQTENGPIKYTDSNGFVRVTIKRGSGRAPGSENPHVEIRNSDGQRTDPFGNPVTRKSPGNHTPIDWDLP